MARRSKQYYLKARYPIRIIADENGGWFVEIPDLPGCMTVVEEFEKAHEAIDLVKEGWIEIALEQGLEIPMPSPQKAFSGKFSLRIPRSLHQRLVGQAADEGMSLNNFCTYLLSLNSGRQVAESARTVNRKLKKAANVSGRANRSRSARS